MKTPFIRYAQLFCSEYTVVVYSTVVVLLYSAKIINGFILTPTHMDFK